MSIYIDPKTRIRQLERENARLRALVGDTQEQVESEDQDASEDPTTLIQKTNDLETAVSLIAEVLL